MYFPALINEYSVFFVFAIPNVYFYFVSYPFQTTKRFRSFKANKWLLRRNKQRLDRLNSLFLVKSREHFYDSLEDWIIEILNFFQVHFLGISRDVYTLSLRLQLDENIWCLRVGYFLSSFRDIFFFFH